MIRTTLVLSAILALTTCFLPGNSLLAQGSGANASAAINARHVEPENMDSELNMVADTGRITVDTVYFIPVGVVNQDTVPLLAGVEPNTVKAGRDESMAKNGQSAETKADAAVFPSATIKTLEGKNLNANTIRTEGRPVFVSFWATWCKPCIQELNAIHNDFETWRQETNVKIVAISIDDARNTSKVKPYVSAKAWEFEVYLDPNAELKRAMNVNNVPHSFLIAPDGTIVSQHNSYSPGDEMKLLEKLRSMVGKK